MSCDAVNILIEAVAAGDPIPDDIRPHLEVCPVCSARLALARQIDAVLSHQPVPSVSHGFTTALMARVRDERWRAERAVDLGFNLAVAAGILIVVAGIAGVAWRAGLLQLGGVMAPLLVEATRTTAARAMGDARLVMTVLLLCTTAIALWWWAEDDVSV
jgi:hypothetical protein